MSYECFLPLEMDQEEIDFIASFHSRTKTSFKPVTFLLSRGLKQ